MTRTPQAPGTPSTSDAPTRLASSPASTQCESLVDLLRLRACESPDNLGYSFLGSDEAPRRQLTYRELDRQARAIGAHLSGMAAPGERVLLLLPHEPEYIAAFFGCLYADLIAVPAFPPSARRVDKRITAIIEDADASVVLVTERTFALLADNHVRYPGLGGRRWIAIERLLDDVDWAPSPTRRSSVAYLQYTSGSTSVPRGVMISHANVLHNLETIRQGIDGRPQTHAVSWAPLFHDLGLVGGMLMPLYHGVPVTTMSPMHFLEDPVRWLRVISAVQASASPGPNFAYDLCVQRTTPDERARLDLRSWNFASVAAEPIRPATLERFAEAFSVAGFRPEAFWPAYGLAESTLAVTAGVLPGQKLARPFDRTALERSAGIPATLGDVDAVRMLATSGRWGRDTEVVIVDPERGVRLPPGRIGEIWCMSESVGQGYWNRPADSASLFQARLADSGDGPFLRTGDLGFVHDGELFITGRLKDLIIIRGRNHHPHDFEHSAESSHPELRRTHVAAFGLEQDGAEQVVIIAEVRRRSWPEPEALAQISEAIRAALAADHQVEPTTIALVGPGSLPKTSSGKLQRSLIRETWRAGGFSPLYLWQRPGSHAAVTSPALATAAQGLVIGADGRTDDLLMALLDCVGRIVGSTVRRFSGDDRLFDLGLDSLGLIHLKLEIERKLGRWLQFAQLEDNPTLRDLAARLSVPLDATAQTVDLRAEAVLDAEIRPAAGQALTTAALREILLTGATGFLGAYLLRELLDQTTAEVFCLVRAPDETSARQRLQHAMTRHGLWDERDAARIRPLPGDLGRPLLGLSPERFASLAGSLDAIYHNGAWLNFVQSYHQLKPANVDGTCEILRLACLSRPKALHYVSTASVFYGAAYDGRLIDEAEPLDHPAGLDLGYIQSKWVAEQLVWAASRRGLPVSVYRPGWILGDSRTGHSSGEELFGRVVRGCVQLGLAPRLDYLWRGAPVDYVSRAIVTLATAHGAAGRAFHLGGSNTISWERLVEWIDAAGYPINLVPFDRWLSELLTSDDNPLLPLLPFLADRASGGPATRPERYAQRTLAHLDDSATLAALPATVPACPPLERELLHRYLDSYAVRRALRT
ncbi:MAG: thioester reductase domain-containing protein [Chloroflexi bacterium]|nr:thioester reductase domain-containing protein [Chloroflexota bacterium]